MFKRLIKFNRLSYILVFFLVIPARASGFSLFTAGTNFKDIIDEILGIIALLTPILFGLAFIVFFWGLSKFILRSDSQADIEKGKTYMIWGIAALFILLTFRTIIGFVSNDLGIGTGVTPTLPESSTP